MKLKYKELSLYRAQQLEQQCYACALCGDEISDDAVLDHDHRSGLIRKVLHRGCNSMLGKIENNMARSRINIDRLQKFCDNLADYIQTTHTELMHPTYKEKTMPGRGKGRKPPKR